MVRAIMGTNVDDAKINLIGEQDLAETAQAIAQALPRHRDRIVTPDTSRVGKPCPICRSRRELVQRYRIAVSRIAHVWVSASG